jgi:hypothetical protein
MGMGVARCARVSGKLTAAYKPLVSLPAGAVIVQGMPLEGPGTTSKAWNDRSLDRVLTDSD